MKNKPAPQPPPPNIKPKLLRHHSNEKYSAEVDNEVVNRAFKEIFSSHGNGSDDNIDDEGIVLTNNNHNNDKLHLSDRKQFKTKTNRPNTDKVEPNKKHSRTLFGFFERAKNLNSRTNRKSNNQKTKILVKKLPPSSSNDMNKFDYNQKMNYQHHQEQLDKQNSYKKAHHESHMTNRNGNFLGGSTVSKSFIKNVNNKKRQPPEPSMTRRTTKHRLIKFNAPTDHNQKSTTTDQANYYNQSNEKFQLTTIDYNTKNNPSANNDKFNISPISHQEYQNPLYLSSGGVANIIATGNHNGAMNQQKRSKSSNELLMMTTTRTDSHHHHHHLIDEQHRNNPTILVGEAGGRQHHNANNMSNENFCQSGDEYNGNGFTTRSSYRTNTNSFKPRTIDRAIL